MTTSLRHEPESTARGLRRAPRSPSNGSMSAGMGGNEMEIVVASYREDLTRKAQKS